jgi:hypothetical protein
VVALSEPRRRPAAAGGRRAERRAIPICALAIAAVAAAGCFTPTERDGAVACSAAGECPPGFTCFAEDQRCYREPPDTDPIDASAIDGGAIDGAPPDSSFMPECSNGIDDDCDGVVDFPADPGCDGADDPNEHGTKQCDDGVDNDQDGATDYKFGPGCATSDPQCADPDDPNESQ